MTKKLIIRPIAALLLISFLFQDIVWANPDIASPKSSLQIPSMLQNPSFEIEIEDALGYILFMHEWKPENLNLLVSMHLPKSENIIVRFDFENKTKEGDDWVVPYSIIGVNKKYEAVVNSEKQTIEIRKAGDGSTVVSSAVVRKEAEPKDTQAEPVESQITLPRHQNTTPQTAPAKPEPVLETSLSHQDITPPDVTNPGPTSAHTDRSPSILPPRWFIILFGVTFVFVLPLIFALLDDSRSQVCTTLKTQPNVFSPLRSIISLSIPLLLAIGLYRIKYKKNYIFFKTEQADYIQHGAMHPVTSKPPESILEKVDGFVLESGSMLYGDKSSILAILHRFHQYEFILSYAEKSKKSIFVTDLAVKLKHARPVVEFCCVLAPTMYCLYSSSYWTMPLLLPMFSMILSPFWPGEKSIPGWWGSFNSLLSLATFYTPSGYRSAITAKKIEEFIVPELKKRGVARPKIFIEFGAKHIDIKTYLQYPWIRNFVIKFHFLFPFIVLRKDYINKIGEVDFSKKYSADQHSNIVYEMASETPPGNPAKIGFLQGTLFLGYLVCRLCWGTLSITADSLKKFPVFLQRKLIGLTKTQKIFLFFAVVAVVAIKTVIIWYWGADIWHWLTAPKLILSAGAFFAIAGSLESQVDKPGPSPAPITPAVLSELCMTPEKRPKLRRIIKALIPARQREDEKLLNSMESVYKDAVIEKLSLCRFSPKQTYSDRLVIQNSRKFAFRKVIEALTPERPSYARHLHWIIPLLTTAFFFGGMSIAGAGEFGQIAGISWNISDCSPAEIFWLQVIIRYACPSILLALFIIIKNAKIPAGKVDSVTRSGAEATQPPHLLRQFYGAEEAGLKGLSASDDAAKALTVADSENLPACRDINLETTRKLVNIILAPFHVGVDKNNPYNILSEIYRYALIKLRHYVENIEESELFWKYVEQLGFSRQELLQLPPFVRGPSGAKTGFSVFKISITPDVIMCAFMKDITIPVEQRIEVLKLFAIPWLRLAGATDDLIALILNNWVEGDSKICEEKWFIELMKNVRDKMKEAAPQGKAFGWMGKLSPKTRLDWNIPSEARILAGMEAMELLKTPLEKEREQADKKLKMIARRLKKKGRLLLTDVSQAQIKQSNEARIKEVCVALEKIRASGKETVEIINDMKPFFPRETILLNGAYGAIEEARIGNIYIDIRGDFHLARLRNAIEICDEAPTLALENELETVTPPSEPAAGSQAMPSAGKVDSVTRTGAEATPPPHLLRQFDGAGEAGIRNTSASDDAAKALAPAAFGVEALPAAFGVEALPAAFGVEALPAAESQAATPGSIQMLDEEQAHNLAVAVNKARFGLRLEKRFTININGHEIGVETNEKCFDEIFGMQVPPVLRIGPLIFVILACNPGNYPDKLQSEIEYVKKELNKCGDIYSKNVSNIFFVGSSYYARGELQVEGIPMSYHTILSIASILANPERFKGYGLDFGTGSDAILARIMMRLGAKVVLMENKPELVDHANIYLKTEGWVSRQGDQGNYEMLTGDLADSSFVHTLFTNSWVQRATASAANIGPFDIYASKNPDAIHPNQSVINIVSQLPHMNFFINAGYYLHRPDHKTSLEKVQEHFDRLGFNVAIVDNEGIKDVRTLIAERLDVSKPTKFTNAPAESAAAGSQAATVLVNENFTGLPFGEVLCECLHFSRRYRLWYGLNESGETIKAKQSLELTEKKAGYFRAIFMELARRRGMPLPVTPELWNGLSARDLYEKGYFKQIAINGLKDYLNKIPRKKINSLEDVKDYDCVYYEGEFYVQYGNFLQDIVCLSSKSVEDISKVEVLNFTQEPAVSTPIPTTTKSGETESLEFPVRAVNMGRFKVKLILQDKANGYRLEGNVDAREIHTEFMTAIEKIQKMVCQYLPDPPAILIISEAGGPILSISTDRKILTIHRELADVDNITACVILNMFARPCLSQKNLSAKEAITHMIKALSHPVNLKLLKAMLHEPCSYDRNLRLTLCNIFRRNIPNTTAFSMNADAAASLGKIIHSMGLRERKRLTPIERIYKSNIQQFALVNEAFSLHRGIPWIVLCSNSMENFSPQDTHAIIPALLDFEKVMTDLDGTIAFLEVFNSQAHIDRMYVNSDLSAIRGGLYEQIRAGTPREILTPEFTTFIKAYQDELIQIRTIFEGDAFSPLRFWEKTTPRSTSAASVGDRLFLRDLTKPREAVQNLLEMIIDVLLSKKKLVLAFHKDLKGNKERLWGPLFKKLENLKKEPRFEKLLKNLIIIPSFNTQEDLMEKLQDQKIGVDKKDNNIICEFAPGTEKENLRSSNEAISSIFIDEGKDFDADIYYYPLLEIVTITLVKYFYGSKCDIRNLANQLGSGLQTLNIESADEQQGYLIFKLIPKTERLDLSKGIDRYILLLKSINPSA